METAKSIIDPKSAEPPFAAWVGIDWADQEHVWCLQVSGSQKREYGKLKNRPEDIQVWISQLCQRFPRQPLAIAIEKHRGALLLQLSRYEQLHLYPIAPQAAANFRKALHPSGATDDTRDAAALLEMLRQHRDHLQRWAPDTEQTRLIQNLVEERRRLVDHKTQLLNGLIAKLKIYFPQMLDWFERLDTPMVAALLQRWPTLLQLQKVSPARLRSFFYKHHCRKTELIEGRIREIRQAVPALQDQAVIQAQVVIVEVITRLLEVVREGIQALERQIQEAVTRHQDFPIFDSFPGAGPALAPRLLAAFGSQRERYRTAAELQNLSGIAPVREQSGRTAWTHFRFGCPKFLRQTFHEWASHSIAFSDWAAAYYHQQRNRGQAHHAAVRALAFKWIRIAFHCWQERILYNEQLYLAALAERGSPLSRAVKKM